MPRVEVLSPVTGTVWKAETAIGTDLPAGGEVMILESMKMEIAVEAPEAGKLAEILVKEQESVEEGQVVAFIETAS